MRRCRLLALLTLLSIALATGCGSTISVSDFGVNPPGCRSPSKCYAIACACNKSPSSPTGLEQCIVCDPQTAPNSTCDCTVNRDPDGGILSQCLEPAQACVGKGPLCPGAGALCVPYNESCSADGGTPPQIVSSPGPSLEAHCAFVDDVCCPGGPAPPDLGVDANPDQAAGPVDANLDAPASSG